MRKIAVTRKDTFTGHRDSVYALEHAPEQHIFFSGSGDGMVVKWDLQQPDNGELIAKLPNSVYAIHHLADSELLAVGHNYEGIHFINWRTRQEVASLKFTDASIFDIRSYANLLIAGTSDGYLHFITIDKLKTIHKEKVAAQNVRCIDINTKNGEFAVGTSDNTILIFDLETLEKKHEIEGHTNSVFSVRYTPDGTTLMSAGRDAHLKIWDTKAGYLAIDDIVAHMYAINHIAFSPDAKHFVTCSMDKTIKLWDTSRLKLLKVIDKARHNGHRSSVNKLLWTAHDNTIVSASDDRTISLWDIEF